MNVRFTIDRLIVEGVELSPTDRLRLVDALRESLTLELNAFARADAPAGRQVDRVRLQAPVAGASGAALGATLGQALAGHAWHGGANAGGRR